MSNNRKNIPIRRFKEFQNADAWEQRKLSDIADLTSSKRIHAQDYVDSGIPFYRGKEITELREHKPVSEVLYITEEKYNEIARLYGSPQVGDLLITAVGTIGNTWVVDNMPFYFKDGNLIWFKNIKCNSNYLDYLLSSDDGQKKIEASAIGSNQKALTMVKLNELRFMFPNDEEQTKIADYFRNLDNLITLHQRKLEKIKALKSAYLSEMFPAEGERKPKRRFAGFTDDWEQRKLGDVLVDMYNGQTPSRNREDYWKGNISWLSSGELNRGTVYNSIEKITEKGLESAHLRIIPKGTFVMAITGLEALGTRGNCALLGIETTLNQSCMALFPNKDLVTSEFLFQWYRKVGEEYGINYTQGTKQQSYNAELLKILPITLPSLAEQQKITECLFNLDNLIILHQRKLDKLQNIKKAYLNEMFV